MDDEELSIDQELAKKLLVEGATLIILNLPTGSEFGIDMKSWHTGHKFKGVKMIPPGLHMYYYNITTKYGDIAPRVSYMHNFKKSEVVVRKWDSDLEELTTEIPTEIDLLRFKSNLPNLDKLLGAYPYDILDKWKSLIKNISEQLISRVTPECGVIRSALDLIGTDTQTGEPPPATSKSSSDKEDKGDVSCDKLTEAENSTTGCENKETKSSEEEMNSVSGGSSSCVSNLACIERRRRKDMEDGLLPQLKPAPGTQLRFTDVPNDLFPQGSTPADITKHSIDPTFTLETLLSSMDNEKEYIGEVELSFVCFLVGLSLDALEAWKRLVVLACRCEKAVIERPNFYSLLLPTLSFQLEHIPEDFLVDIVESENAVYMSLRDVFRTTLTGEGVKPKLKKTALAISEKLSNRFGWDFTNLDEDDEDEAPVIVDLGDCSSGN